MKFSVLMSVYFKEKPEYLEKAMDSILINQTIKPTEVVLVKDGPLTNELDQIINTYKQRYADIVNIVELKENQGLGQALNIGLIHCKYHIVARMDTDDISMPNRFEQQLKIFEINEYDVVGSNIYEFEEDEDNIMSIKKVPENHSDIVKYSKFRNPINHPTVMFKKQSVIQAGSYEHCLYFEDYYLWLRMLNSNMTFYNIQEPLLKFRFNVDMIKRRSGINYFKRELSFLKLIRKKEYISESDYLKNIIIKLSARLLPNFVLKNLYLKFLRKDAKN